LEKLIRYLGRSLLNHIEIEKNKSEEILNTPSLEGKPAKYWIDYSYTLITDYFKDTSSWEKHDFNLVKEKFKVMKTNNYENSSFEVLGLLLVGMLIDFDKNNEKSRQEYKEFTLHFFSKFDAKKFGLTTNKMIQTETIFIELIRKEINILYTNEDANKKNVWQIFLNQRIDFMGWINAYFESILQDSLNETEKLLHNILPKPICLELQKNDKVIPKKIENATVLFTDFVGFTQFTEKLTASQVVDELDICFSKFDKIVKHFGLEKIKTLGDGYMCAGGVPNNDKTHVYKTCLAALQMNETIKTLKKERNLPCGNYWSIRIGIHTGSLVAGVIGKHKFSYDIWGDTVNIASRMESSGISGGVNISSQLNSMISKFFETEYRGSINAKNKGSLDMYHLKRLKKEYSQSSCGTVPNEKLFKELDN
jgi:class 3 adenylate cyclase